MPDRVRILETLVAVAIIGHASIAAGQDLQKRLGAGKRGRAGEGGTARRRPAAWRSPVSPGVSRLLEVP